MLAGRPAQDVEDAVQDVFERVHTALRFGREMPLSLRVWLYRIARNRCIDELRRRPPAAIDMFAASRTPVCDTNAVAERRADVARLVADLRELPEQQRSALLMRELQGLSHTELAEVLGISVSAVKALLVRARTGLTCAAAARETSCETIRADLTVAHDRGVKASGQARRHLRECNACRDYRGQLQRTTRAFAALLPAPALGPLALLAQRVFRGAGLGGSGASAGTAGSGGLVLSGAGKVVMLVGAAAAVTAGGVLESTHSGTSRSPAGVNSLGGSGALSQALRGQHQSGAAASVQLRGQTLRTPRTPLSSARLAPRAATNVPPTTTWRESGTPPSGSGVEHVRHLGSGTSTTLSGQVTSLTKNITGNGTQPGVAGTLTIEANNVASKLVAGATGAAAQVAADAGQLTAAAAKVADSIAATMPSNSAVQQLARTLHALSH
jgi:RNA polymerase sigma factor (sigma-70 family)